MLIYRKVEHLPIVCISNEWMIVISNQNEPVIWKSFWEKREREREGEREREREKDVPDELSLNITCWTPAMYLVIYSTETGSSTVKRWLWHSMRALFINTRASAFNPNWKSKVKYIRYYYIGLWMYRLKFRVDFVHDGCSYTRNFFLKKETYQQTPCKHGYLTS